MFDLVIAWTRVHAIDAPRSDPAGSDAHQAATSPAKGKTVWNIVPHGENRGKFRRERDHACANEREREREIERGEEIEREREGERGKERKKRD